MSGNAALALWLEGPMQSWGYQSVCNRRTTLSYPTQSGVVGLLGAALGVARGDRKGVEELCTLGQEVLVFGEPMRWTDFHTVGGGYMGNQISKEKHIPMAAVLKRNKDGTLHPKKEATLTWREYLADACFGVILVGDSALLARCDVALANPKWSLYLGRKCCIPSSPLSRGLHADSKTAEECLQEEAGRRGRKLRRRIKTVATFKEGTDTLHDVPIDFEAREFSVRRVRVTDVS